MQKKKKERYVKKKKKRLGFEMGRVYPYSPSDSGKTLEEPSVIHPFQASLALRIKKKKKKKID